MSETTRLPPRFRAPSALAWVLVVGFAAFFIQGLIASEISLDRLVRGASNLVRFIGQAVPPDFSRSAQHRRCHAGDAEHRGGGRHVRLPLLDPPGASGRAQHRRPMRWSGRWRGFVISVSRTIPDLIWALIFVVTVGLGPLAGILAIIMDTIGFAARFYSERFEEVQKGPSEALTSTGAGRLSVDLRSDSCPRASRR